MTFEIERIKRLSKKLGFNAKLKFDIKCLKIRINNNWIGFENFITPEPIVIRDHEFARMALSYVLLDTGNLTDYLSLSAHFLEQFKKQIKDIRCKERIKLTYECNEIPTFVSLEKFTFKFFNSIFEAKLGFATKIDYFSVTEINIGIHSIRQFLNIIIPSNNCYYYHCRNYK